MWDFTPRTKGSHWRTSSRSLARPDMQLLDDPCYRTQLSKLVLSSKNGENYQCKSFSPICKNNEGLYVGSWYHRLCWVPALQSNRKANCGRQQLPQFRENQQSLYKVHEAWEIFKTVKFLKRQRKLLQSYMTNLSFLFAWWTWNHKLYWKLYFLIWILNDLYNPHFKRNAKSEFSRIYLWNKLWINLFSG